MRHSSPTVGASSSPATSRSAVLGSTSSLLMVGRLHPLRRKGFACHLHMPFHQTALSLPPWVSESDYSSAQPLEDSPRRSQALNRMSSRCDGTTTEPVCSFFS